MKVDARRFGAFDSPNCPPLATVEAGIEGMIKIDLAVGGAVSEIMVNLNPFLNWIHLTQDSGDSRLDKVVVLWFRQEGHFSHVEPLYPFNF